MYIIRPLWPVNILKPFFFAGFAGPEDPTGEGMRSGDARRPMPRTLLRAAPKHRFATALEAHLWTPDARVNPPAIPSREHSAGRQSLRRPAARPSRSRHIRPP